MVDTWSVYVLQDALSYEVLTLRPRQIVLAILGQQDNTPVLHLKLPVLFNTLHLHQQALGGLRELGEIQASTAVNWTHVGAQSTTVTPEPLDFLLAEGEPEIRRQDASRLPSVVFYFGHSPVDIG